VIELLIWSRQNCGPAHNLTYRSLYT
jgi:hypothetical protein